MASQMTIHCIGCGDDKGTTKAQYEKLVTLGKIDSYLCRSCRPKKSKHVKIEANNEVLDGIDDSEDTFNPKSGLSLPDWMKNYTPNRDRAPLSKEEYGYIDVCFRPDIFYGNKRNNNDDGSCDGCKMFEYCGCLGKVLKKV